MIRTKYETSCLDLEQSNRVTVAPVICSVYQGCFLSVWLQMIAMLYQRLPPPITIGNVASTCMLLPIQIDHLTHLDSIIISPEHLSQTVTECVNLLYITYMPSHNALDLKFEIPHPLHSQHWLHPMLGSGQMLLDS